MALGNEVGLHYRDARGNESDRVISIKEIYKSDNGIAIDALCHVRDAPRTFLSHRIRALYEPDTGELIEEVDAALLRHALFNPNRTPPQKDWKMPNALESQLEALGYLASFTDGQAKEKAKIILDYVKQFWPVPTNQEDKLLGFIYRLDPEEAFIYDGLSEVADADEAQVRAFCEATIAMVDLDGEIVQEEEDFLSDLQEELREGGHNVTFSIKVTESDDEVTPDQEKSEGVPGYVWALAALLVLIVAILA